PDSYPHDAAADSGGVGADATREDDQTGRLTIIPMKNPYDILSIQQDAPMADISKGFNLALIHNMKTKLHTPQEMMQAKTQLSDPARRNLLTPLSALEDLQAQQLTLTHSLKKQLAEKELEKQDQLREFLLGLIEILDALEQKEANLRERYADDPDALKIVTNHASLQKRVWRQLERYGVSRVDFKKGKLIVGLSKVVETMPDASKPNESIISIVSHGYIRGNTVLREAELIVVKN
nr:hypothetical protein [Tanacetum cinerariifolium]